ncbi:MAG: hypothetical protein JJE30_06605 [Desulfuromonadales bacterium]|nr:hypothetical protein [Desulfuromonadales bacterium]
MQIDIKPQYSRLIGLTKGDEVARAHSVSGRDENNILHIFARLNNGAGYYLTREPSPDEMHLYWVGFDFKVIAAISVSKDNGTAVIPAAEAQKELASEYAEWIEFADTL